MAKLPKVQYVAAEPEPAEEPRAPPDDSGHQPVDTTA